VPVVLAPPLGALGAGVLVAAAFAAVLEVFEDELPHAVSPAQASNMIGNAMIAVGLRRWVLR
jgi:hypothetical protein